MLQGATDRGRRRLRPARRRVRRRLPAVMFAVGTFVAAGACGGAEGSVAAADPECLKAWNTDAEALEFGRHQFGFHQYTEVRVLRVSADGEPVAGDPGAPCAVAFAGATLDPEYGAAVRILEDGRWVALETLPAVSPDQLARLQADAQAAPNATLSESGRLEPLATTTR
jgi:hypothetical protein